MALQQVTRALQGMGIASEIDMEDVKDSLNGNLNSLIRVLDTVKKACAVKIAFKPVKQDRECVYKIVNPAFKPCCRWLLRFVGRDAKFQTECKQMLVELDKTDVCYIFYPD